MQEPHGKVHRVSSLSIKMNPDEVVTPLPEAVKLPPMEQEALEESWKSMLDFFAEREPKLVESLKGRTIRLEGEDFFVIEVGNSYVEAEIRPHLRDMLEQMRAISGHKLLNCKVEVVYEEKEAKIYAPRDKYQVMAKENPVLETFRILFPEVDL